jgi:hypothetical protein
MRKKSKADYFKPKIMVANREDLTTAYIQRLNKLGYVMLILCIPDEEAHPGEAENVSVYGNIEDHFQQVAVLRAIADKIESSVEGMHKEPLARTDN